MAAGEGTRLRPFTDIVPKPLIPIWFKDGCMHTIIEKLIYQIKEAGINDVAIVVNYKKELIKDYLKDGSRFGVKIRYFKQEVLDGNAGAISRCKPFIDDDILFTDADNFVSDSDVFLKLKNIFEEGADAVVGVKKVENPKKYAIFKEKDGNIIDICEKPEDESFGNLAKTGFGIISRELAEKIEEISKEPSNKKTTTQLFKYIINNNLRLKLFFVESDFADLGTWEDYRKILKKEI